MEAGFPENELPKTEFLCRTLKKLPPDRLAKIWKAVLAQAKERGKAPTTKDVEDAANNDSPPSSSSSRKKPKSDAARDDMHKAELLKSFRAVARKLKVGLDPNVLTSDFRARLEEVLEDILIRAQAQMATLHRVAEQEGQEGQAPPPKKAPVPMERDGHEQFDAARAVMEEKGAVKAGTGTGSNPSQ